MIEYFQKQLANGVPLDFGGMNKDEWVNKQIDNPPSSDKLSLESYYDRHIPYDGQKLLLYMVFTDSGPTIFKIYESELAQLSDRYEFERMAERTDIPVFKLKDTND